MHELFYYGLLAQLEERLSVKQRVGGSIPSQSAKEVITMRGSRIAKEIEQEIRREKARREKILEVLRRKRGESNGKRESDIVRGSNNG